MAQIKVKVWRMIYIIILLLFLMTGCARMSQQGVEEQDVKIELVTPMQPSVLGSSQIELRVTDMAGRPINDAVLELKGDMTHAGMVPILASVSGGENGLYSVPFEWTMAGDWILIVGVNLPDGRYAERQFKLFVDGAGVICQPDEP